jgi:hypothetical protein
MQMGVRSSNTKWHSPAPTVHSAEMHTTSMNQSSHSGAIPGGIAGEDRNLPGQRSAQFLTNDYGEQRHMAYDTPLAQPVYSGHGKVQVGKTSDL